MTYKWYNSNKVAGYDRFIDGLKNVTTDYVQFMPDDDYFNELTMRKHVTLLDKDKDLVGAYGHSLAFNLSKNKKETFWWLLDEYTHNNSDESHPDPMKRMFYATFDRNRNAYFSLYRTEVLLRLYQKTSKAGIINSVKKGKLVADTKFFYLGDFAFTYFSLMAGERKNSHFPMMAYEIGNEVAEVGKGGERVVHNELVLDKEFNFIKRTKKVVDALVAEYEYHHKTKKPEALRKWFESILLTWLSTLGLFANSSINHLNNALSHLGRSYDKLFLVHPTVFTHDKINFNSKQINCRNCEIRNEEICKKYLNDYQFLFSEMKKIADVPFRVKENGFPELDHLHLLLRERPKSSQEKKTEYAKRKIKKEPQIKNAIRYLKGRKKLDF